MSAPQSQTHARQAEALRRAMGPEILEPLGDPQIVEIMLNPDGNLWVDRLGAGMTCTGRIDPVRALTIVNTVAAMLDTVVTAERPILECELPLDGSRFEALIPPLVEHAGFALRKKATLVFTLEDYVAKGIMSAAQRRAIEEAVAGRQNVLVCGGTGCHEADASILMFDGSTKRAADVRVGDSLMGPDSRPRTVLTLHGGIDDMVRIKPIKGERMIVNAGHILSLISTPRSSGEPRKVVNIPVRAWMQTSAKFKHIHKMRRVAVDFAEKRLPVDPYFLGLLLGDGCLSSGSIGIAKPDPEIFERIMDEAIARGLHVSAHGRGTSMTYRLCGNGRGAHSNNTLIRDVAAVGLRGTTSGDKFIPNDYKTASRQQRLDLLAGILDTDGSWSNGGFDYITKSRRLADDVQFLCRSLGLAAQVHLCEKSCNAFTGSYYRLFISGACDTIPCRIPRKKGAARRQKKDPLVTGFAVEPVGVGRYYGFEVDADNLYLDGQFFVHHNTGKTTLANAILDCVSRVDSEHRVVVIEDTRELQVNAENVVFLRTSDNTDMTRLLRATMRLRPDRIVVGEVRDGSALALLKAWNTGHPGGVGTVHANDASAALIRVGQLIQEAGVPPNPELIAEAVNVVVSIKRTTTGRRVEEVAAVRGWSAGGGFHIERMA